MKLEEILKARRVEIERIEMGLRHLFRSKGLSRAEKCVDMLPRDHPFVVNAKSSPVWALSGEAFYHLSWHGLIWDGKNEETIRYFLPRLLSDWIRDKSYFDVDTIARELGHHEWRKWDDNERSIIEECLTFVWETITASEDRWFDVTSVICSFAFLKEPLVERFDRGIAEAESSPGLIQWFCMCDEWDRRSFQFGGPFRKGAEDELANLLSYLLSRDFLSKVEAKCLQTADSTLSATLSYLFGMLEGLASHPPEDLAVLMRRARS